MRVAPLSSSLSHFACQCCVFPSCTMPIFGPLFCGRGRSFFLFVGSMFALLALLAWKLPLAGSPDKCSCIAGTMYVNALNPFRASRMLGRGGSNRLVRKLVWTSSFDKGQCF